MDEIILVGSGGHARSCIDVIEQHGFFAIAGLVENNEPINEDVLGYPIVGSDNDLLLLHAQYKFALVSIGQIKSSSSRVAAYQRLKEIGYILPAIISPRAYVSRHANVGEGTVIMHGAIVNANAVIGKNCILNSRALIEHDAVVGDHCHISTGAIVNGEAKIGKESFIGSGAVTRQLIDIEEQSVIGAGSFVKSNVESKRLIKK
jgi:sugar O-acyltransferase (sialic acid O-acetyltransferase NeuD family)